jgi:hypothetical protein
MQALPEPTPIACKPGARILPRIALIRAAPSRSNSAAPPVGATKLLRKKEE